MRAVSVLSVAEPPLWAEIEALAPLAPHVEQVLDARRRVVGPSFERDVLPALRDRVLVRYARRDPSEVAERRRQLAGDVAALGDDARRVLVAAQRHALGEVVIGRQAWDPDGDAAAVRALVGAGLLAPIPGDDAPPRAGRYRLHADLPPATEFVYDFDEAAMEETDDLSDPRLGPLELLHDMASLAAALEHAEARVTQAGTVAVADAREVGRRLASSALAASGRLEEDERWGRALRGLKALNVVSSDPLDRTLHLDLGLETVLAGETEDATDRLVHRLLDRDLHVVVPAVRAALRQAGEGAIDEVVFLELLREQHRDVLFPAWRRDGALVYPMVGDERARAYGDDAFDDVEAPMIRAALAKMQRFGLVRRAPGVFAATADGRRWAGATLGPRPPVWAAGDLELVVPPDALTVWERFQVERLGRCLQRDVVDRFRLDREGLVTWLSTHEVDEALALLIRRCPALPGSVSETLLAWASSAQRVVLTRGVLLPG